MSLVFQPLEFFWHETPPPAENSTGETTVPNAEPTGSAGESRVFSADDFDRFQRSVNERFDQIGQRVDGFGQQITEGFEWVKGNLAPTSPAGDGEPDSPSENPAETTIEVQDRPPIKNRNPRIRLNLGNLFR